MPVRSSSSPCTTLNEYMRSRGGKGSHTKFSSISIRESGLRAIVDPIGGDMDKDDLKAEASIMLHGVNICSASMLF
jgi:hypothetical protein